ncbi:MAG: hypothetical protein IJP83_02825 [Mycoplasma sp.]|nr:hypothetical protein [Mycoplasma sp.]
MSNFNFDFIRGRLIKFVSWIIYVLVIAFFVWKIKLIDNELINPKQNKLISIITVKKFVWYNSDKIDGLFNKLNLVR